MRFPPFDWFAHDEIENSDQVLLYILSKREIVILCKDPAGATSRTCCSISDQSEQYVFSFDASILRVGHVNIDR